MIVDFLLYLLYGIVYLVTSPLRLFSDVSQASWLASTVSSASSYLSFGAHWLPKTVYALLLTWGLYITIEIAIFSYKGIMWVLKKLPVIK